MLAFSPCKSGMTAVVYRWVEEMAGCLPVRILHAA